MTELEVVREEIKHLITAIRAHAEVAREFPRFRVRYYFKNVHKVTLGMEDVVREVADCRRCPLHKGRTHIVFGEGNTKAKLVFVGEAPGADEDRLGRPFVGKAGQLLTRIIEAMGMRREDVYICNVLKCRPPGNRTPLPQEMEVCGPFLEKQLEVIKPTVICALGSIAAKALLKTEAPITALRGRFHDYRGIPCLPTFHPAYLLRNPAAKKQVWQDMKLIMERLGI